MDLPNQLILLSWKSLKRRKYQIHNWRFRLGGFNRFIKIWIRLWVRSRMCKIKWIIYQFQWRYKVQHLEFQRNHCEAKNLPKKWKPVSINRTCTLMNYYFCFRSAILYSVNNFLMLYAFYFKYVIRGIDGAS